MPEAGQSSPARWRPLLPWGLLLALFLVLCGGAPLFAPHDPDEQPDPVGGRLRPPGTTLHAVALTRGGWLLADRVERLPRGLRVWRGDRVDELTEDEVSNLTTAGVADRHLYLLGSDPFSRDVLSRWLYGGRLSLLIGVASVTLSMILGIGLGALAALGGRLVDGVLMRLVDGLRTVPWLFLLIALRALMPSGAGTLILILGATSWMSVARLARSEILTLRQRDFVLAARGLGLRETTVFWRHVLPNALTPLAVSGVLGVGYLISAEAGLSFLGLGVEAPAASWGTMIEGGRQHLARAWWLITFPAVGLIAVVVTLNILADRLRDALDPRHQPTRS